MGVLPEVVPLATRNLTPRGHALGCDLEGVDSGDLLFRPRCNVDTTEPKDGLGITLATTVALV